MPRGLTSDQSVAVRAIVRAELRAMFGRVLEEPGEPYSTRKGREPEEFRGQAKRWRAVAPTIPGAVRIGRWWSVSRANYAAWCGGARTDPTPAPTARAWDPYDAIEKAGLRVVRPRAAGGAK
ncbi:MAG: hypothetical protein M3O50_12940 [Myxococcota bacterium]|nr:hypothetical protein [Myxococcota bacterium]